jgi:hypothetical protein
MQELQVLPALRRERRHLRDLQAEVTRSLGYESLGAKPGCQLKGNLNNLKPATQPSAVS